LLLHLNRVDFVVGGCGTGQGFLNAVMQYPGVCCGHILNPLDAWLFMQINSGNCISLALNQGYGWAGDVNLAFIFDRLFSVESGCGYPPHRQVSQCQSREILQKVGEIAHKSMCDIILSLPDSVLEPAVTFPGVLEFLNLGEIEDDLSTRVLIQRLSKMDG